MPLSSFSINPFPKKPRESTTDELAAVKAAAWAWYQHGSGSEPKTMLEFRITRTSKLPKPSRYKLEAIKFAQKFIEGKSQTPYSLLDKYEIDTISRQLSGFLDPGFSRQGFVGELDRYMERKKSVKLMNFSSLWRRNSVICGKTDDVVASSLVRRRSVHK